MARATDVDGTVENTACDRFAAGLNTPLMVQVKSASSSSVSRADLSMPVTSWTPRGVANCRLVKSLRRSCRVLVASPTLNVVHARPVDLAIGGSLPCAGDVLLQRLVMLGGLVV